MYAPTSGFVGSSSSSNSDNICGQRTAPGFRFRCRSNRQLPVHYGQASILGSESIEKRSIFVCKVLQCEDSQRIHCKWVFFIFLLQYFKVVVSLLSNLIVTHIDYIVWPSYSGWVRCSPPWSWNHCWWASCLRNFQRHYGRGHRRVAWIQAHWHTQVSFFVLQHF